MSTSSTVPEIAITRVRVVAHTMGPVVPGGQLSLNHWSIYLLSAAGGSVRLNMTWDPQASGDIGKFTAIRYRYAKTVSALRIFDYDVQSGVKVKSFLKTIANKKRQRYKMTSTGVGCRDWVMTVFHDWVEAGLITTKDAANILANVIQYNYSKNQTPIKLEMKSGEWY